jgi:HlyD family secretion protein
MKRFMLVFVLMAAVGGAAGAFYNSRTPDAPAINTARVTTGSVVETVSATGTLQAVTTVQVGTQVSGTVAWLGADYNSIVHKGDIIARLDTSLFDAQMAQARASLAKVAADVDNAQVQLADARGKYDRAQALSAKSLLARSELDAARVAVDTEAARVKSAQAQLAQAEATLGQAEVNRNHATIAAPIDGIVIQRSVDVGQTVAATMSSPTIFSIAADLSRMQVQASIDESDIGRIAAGQPVSFTVDAYPNERFTGTTVQVRLQPAVIQNVTTYTVVIDVPNRDLRLKPGMTATVNIETARRDDVLRLANAALRFTPSADALRALSLDETLAQQKAPKGSRQVWVRENGTLRAVPVTVGLSDGQSSEIVAGGLAADAEVVTSIAMATETVRNTTANPASVFMGGGPPPGGFSGGNRTRGGG